jgi:hypothetical protein
LTARGLNGKIRIIKQILNIVMTSELISKNKYIIIAIILIFGIGAGTLGYFQYKKNINPNPSVSPTASAIPSNSPTPSAEPQNNNITYTTFSSPKTDFTFEYPNTWVYDEKPDPYNAKSTDWSFYNNPNNKTGMPVFAVISPLTEIVDFCSAKGMAEVRQFSKIAIYKTNDPRTYITYEQCGNIREGHAYIYWQKGKRFSDANDIKNILQVNLISFYFTPDLLKGSEISQHVAQSIKIK